MKKTITSIFYHPFLLIVVGWLVFFWQEIVLGKVLYCCDNLLINIPQKLFLVRELSHGRFPLWNPYIFSGSPYLADINLASLYPMNLIFLFIEPFRAATWFTLIHYLIAGFGVYILARRLLISRLIAVLPAFIYMFSGVMVGYANNFAIVPVVAFLPWVVWAWITYTKKPTNKTFAALVSLSSLQIFSGHPQMTYYTWLVGVGYFVILSKESIPKRILLVGVISVCMAFVAGVQVLPFVELVQYSTRLGQGLDYSSFGSFHPLWFIRLLIPSMTGDPRNATAWVQLGSTFGYVGLLPLFLSIIAFVKTKQGKIWGGAAILSLSIAFGKYFPTYYLLYYLVPGFRYFRVPSNFLVFWSLSIAIASSIGLTYLLGKKHLMQIAHLKKTSFILVCIGIATFIFYAVHPETFLYNTLILLGGKFAIKSVYIGPFGILFLLKAININLLFQVSVFFLFFLSLNFRQINKKIVLVCVLVFIDLFMYSRYTLTSVPLQTITESLSSMQKTITMLPDFNPEIDRLYVDPAVYWAPRNKVFGLQNEFEETRWALNILRPNVSIFSGIPVIDGYASIVNKNYQEYFSGSVSDPGGIHIATIDSPHVDLAGAKYIITVSDNSLLQADSKFTMMTALNGPLSIFENSSAMPRFFTEIQGKKDAQGIHINIYEPDSVTLNVTMPEDGKLVFADSIYPGWTVQDDTASGHIEKYEHIFKSVTLSAGVHTVTFTFRPLSVMMGLIMSVIGIFILILLSIF